MVPLIHEAVGKAGEDSDRTSFAHVTRRRFSCLILNGYILFP